MTPPPIRRSPRSSRNWPPLVIDLHGSPRLALAWVAWCLALALALWLGCALPWWAGPALALLLLALAWGGVVVLLGHGSGGRAPWVGGRLSWESDGRWWFKAPRLAGAYVQTVTPRRLGTVLWLRWMSTQGRCLCILDAAAMEPKAWARLKARMRLQVPAARG